VACWALLTESITDDCSLQDLPQIIEILVKNSDDPDEYGYFGKTPIMIAAYETNLAAVEMLLKLGADPNIPSRTGCNPIVATLLRSTTTNEVLILFMNIEK